MQNIIKRNCPRQKGKYKVFCYMVATGKGVKEKAYEAAKRKGSCCPKLSVTPPPSFYI